MQQNKTSPQIVRKGREDLIKMVMLLAVVVVAREYARACYVTLDVAQIWVYGVGERPYVYRALVPWLARMLVWLGLREDVALACVVMFSAIGLVYGIKYLLGSLRRAS